jgi:RNA polymerase sigma factor (sigma-70 family)
MYLIRQFMRMNGVQPEQIEQFVLATSGQGLSVREVEQLAHGFFRGPDSFRQEILKGNLALPLARMRQVPQSPDGCSEFERVLLGDLELTQKYMQRVMGKSQEHAKLSSRAFHAQCHLLTAGSLQRESLTLKRGEGKVVVTSELQGLDLTDQDVAGSSDKDDEQATSNLEGKINREYSGWSAHAHAGGPAAANRADQMRLISEAMGELSPKDRLILELRHLGGLKHRAIAEQVGESTGQIGKELERAEEKLRKIVNTKLLIEKRTLL